MKRFFNILLIVCLGLLVESGLASCRGKGATKAIEAIEKAASKSGKTIKNVGKYGDDVYRTIEKYNSSTEAAVPQTVTIECALCGGYGQINFVDEYGNYDYTGTCPDCGGAGTITYTEYE